MLINLGAFLWFALNSLTVNFCDKLTLWNLNNYYLIRRLNLLSASIATSQKNERDHFFPFNNPLLNCSQSYIYLLHWFPIYLLAFLFLDSKRFISKRENNINASFNQGSLSSGPWMILKKMAKWCHINFRLFHLNMFLLWSAKQTDLLASISF